MCCVVLSVLCLLIYKGTSEVGGWAVCIPYVIREHGHHLDTLDLLAQAYVRLFLYHLFVGLCTSLLAFEGWSSALDGHEG
jgi:hypothetical protein